MQKYMVTQLSGENPTPIGWMAGGCLLLVGLKGRVTGVAFSQNILELTILCTRNEIPLALCEKENARPIL